MPLPTDSYVIGTHAWFYREGNVITVAGTHAGAATGPCTKINRAGATDPLWIYLGVIEESEDSPPEGQKIELWIPSPGKLILKDTITTKRKIMKKFTSNELSAFAVECLYGTLDLSAASTQFNHNEGPSDKKGWLKVQRYDHNNNQRIVEDVWVNLALASPIQFGGTDAVKAAFEALVLHSTLNTGTL